MSGLEFFMLNKEKMRVLKDKNGLKKIVFLSRQDKDYLIYMCSDVWVTPALKKFKHEILERVREDGRRTDAKGEFKFYSMKLNDIRWDREVKAEVWKKGRINPNYAPHVVRLDEKGRIMMWSKYGRTDSIFGWTIEWIDPHKNNEPDNLENLQPVNSYIQHSK